MEKDRGDDDRLDGVSISKLLSSTCISRTVQLDFDRIPYAYELTCPASFVEARTRTATSLRHTREEPYAISVRYANELGPTAALGEYRYCTA